MTSSRWPLWILAYGAGFGGATLLTTFTRWGGNAAFITGAVVILVSIGFIGTGGSTGIKVIRNLAGMPVATEKVEPAKRSFQISRGVRVFLLGLAIWAPLLVRAFL